MPDPRFFAAHGPISLGELAALAGAAIADPRDAELTIIGAAPLNASASDLVSFLGDHRYIADLEATKAGACFVTPAMADHVPAGCVRLLTPEPQAAFSRAAAHLYRPIVHERDSGAIHPLAEIEPGARLGPGVTVGQGAKIGSGSEIGPNTVIGPGVALGRDCRIGANVSIGFALIGDRVKILAGAVIGEAGFGVAGSKTGAIDVPQLGRVILQDDVTVGAASCIDRGAYTDTVIGQYTKIDNLVQIAHNVVIGRNCILAAQTGLSGSVVVGDGVQFGGKAGAGDHLTVHAGARLAAGALTMRDVPAGETWCGVPARPIRRFMRELAWVSHAVGKEKGKVKGARNADG